MQKTVVDLQSIVINILKTDNRIHLNNKLVSNKIYCYKIEKYLQQIDVGIRGIDIQTKLTIDEETGREKKIKSVKTIHDVFDDSGNIIGKKYFDLHQESTGTLRFLSYIQNVIDMIDKGGIYSVFWKEQLLVAFFTFLITLLKIGHIIYKRRNYLAQH